MASEPENTDGTPLEPSLAGIDFVRIDEVRPEDYDGTCLRPLGLCELGGACDSCWYSPDHPRFNKGS